MYECNKNNNKNIIIIIIKLLQGRKTKNATFEINEKNIYILDDLF